MKAELNNHFIYATMMLLTIFSYGIAKFGFNGRFIALILLITSAIKGHLIIRDFMQLRDVSFLWRAIMYGWLGIVISAIFITYLLSFS